MSFGGIPALLLAILLAGAGGIAGYTIGHGVGYLEGHAAGKAAEAAEINTQGENLAQKAQEARKPALVAGAAARLREQWCRDC